MKKMLNPKIQDRSLLLSISLISLLIVVGSLLTLMTPSTYVVFGANQSNITSQVNVTNTEPWVDNVLVDDSIASPVGEINLQPSTTINVWCNSTIHDYNGADDIAEVNATLYHQSVGVFDTEANSSLYNSVCYNVSQDTITANYMCNFTVPYYTWNGSWQCNVSVIDSRNLTARNASSTYVNELYAITVPGVIDYGNMEVNTNSGVEVPKNITNVGNMVLDLDLYGFAETVDDGYAMACTQGNDIPIGNQFFDINISGNNTFAYKTALSGLQGTPNQVNLNLDLRNDSNGYNYTGWTDWKLQVPFSVAGWCNGTVVFSGVPNTYS